MKKAFRACLDCHTKMTEFLGSLVREKNKTQEHLVTAHQVTQYPDDMEKGDKIGSSIEESKKQQYV